MRIGLISLLLVTPFVGVWIEIFGPSKTAVRDDVTPFVGVWIEIHQHYQAHKEAKSHSLRGSVD